MPDYPSTGPGNKNSLSPVFNSLVWHSCLYHRTNSESIYKYSVEFMVFKKIYIIILLRINAKNRITFT